MNQLSMIHAISIPDEELKSRSKLKLFVGSEGKEIKDFKMEN